MKFSEIILSVSLLAVMVANLINNDIASRVIYGCVAALMIVNIALRIKDIANRSKED